VFGQDEIIHAKRVCTFPEKLYAPYNLGILVDRKPDHGCTTDGKLIGIEPGPGHFRDKNGSGHFPDGIGKDVTFFYMPGYLALYSPAEPGILGFPDIDKGNIIGGDMAYVIEEKVRYLLDPYLHIG
jgi:hypothetical protein